MPFIEKICRANKVNQVVTVNIINMRERYDTYYHYNNDVKLKVDS